MLGTRYGPDFENRAPETPLKNSVNVSLNVMKLHREA